MEKVVLGGYFGFGNLGDDAILLSQINFLKKNGFEPIVLTYRGRDIFGVKGVDRTSVGEILKIKNEFNVFILGGGGLFQDKTSFKSLIYYLLLIDFMKRLRKKVILFNVGIGPIIRNISKKILYYSLKRSDLLIFRDRFSFDFYPNLKNRSLGFDSAFGLSFKRGSKERKILVSIRSFEGFNLSKFKRFFTLLKEKIPIFYEFIVFNKTEIDIANALNLPYFYSKDPIQALERISKGEFLIGTRYHSIIFSIMGDTPFISIPYDIKVRNITKEVGFNDFLELKEDASVWVRKSVKAFNEKEKRRKVIEEKRMEFEERLRDSFKILLNFLKNGHI